MNVVQDKSQLVPTSDPKSNPLPAKGARDPTMGNSSAKSPSSPSRRQYKQGQGIATVPPHVFAENVRPPIVVEKLPEPDERLISTLQLACCLGLLKDPHSLDDILEPAARNWLR